MNLDLSPLAQTIAAQVACELAPLLRQHGEQWMTSSEAAEYLRCSQQTLTNMAAAKKIPGRHEDAAHRLSEALGS